MPYRTGYEEVIGGRVDDLFVVTADDEGKVIAVNDKYLTVEYKTLGKKVYELGVTHGTVSGTTIPHNRITDLKVGHEFKAKDALIFNSGFFQRSELNPNNVIYKHGIIAKVAFMENCSTLEDGNVVSHELAEKLVTPGTTLHAVVVDFDIIIHNLITTGHKVDPETILCTMENFISHDIEAKDAEAIKALTRISANNPKAKVYGVVSNIEVVYFGNLEDMHHTLQQIVTKYDNLRAKRVNTLGIDEAKIGQVKETIRVAGKKLLQNQVAIKIYIDGEISHNMGD